MITINHQYEGVDHQKFDTYAELLDWMLASDVLNHTQVQVHNLGESSMPGADVYGFSYGDLNKPMLFIEYQIHGRHEWHCSHYGFRFFEMCVRGELGNEVKTIMAEFCLYVIPCLNPYGYENGTYQNGNNVNLNRNFDYKWKESNVITLDEYDPDNPPGAWYGSTKGNAPFDQPESRMVRDIVLQYQPILFADFHTRGENTIGSFLPGNNQNRIFRKPLFREMTYAFRKQAGHGIAYTDAQDRDELTADCWATAQPSRMGSQMMGMTLETPELIDNKTAHYQGITLSLLAILYATRYFKNRSMTQC